jgi:hypothetical protein
VKASRLLLVSEPVPSSANEFRLVPLTAPCYLVRRSLAFALLALGAVLWLLYGVLIRAWPVIITNGSILVLVGAILAAKLRFD